MPKKHLGLLLGVLALMVPASAGAAPVTVNVRVEGPTQTFFEGPVTTDVRDWQFSGDPTTHACDGTAAVGGSSASPVPTGGAALMAAGLTTTGTWYDGLGFSLATINGVGVSESVPPYRYMTEYYNGVFASLGSCAQPVANGDDYLFAYTEYDSPALRLTALDRAIAAGGTARLKVVDADGPVSGAVVDGKTSDASGDVTIGPLGSTGVNSFKATKSGSVRSNAAKICVNVAASLCGTPDKTPPTATIAIKNGKKYKKKGPRLLKGSVADSAGIANVELRLTARPNRRSKKCTTFDAKKTKFVKQKRCGALRGKAFAVDASGGKWSYLLPKAPGKGRYVLDLIVTDTSGNTSLKRAIFYVI
jgi:hypothetical protein